MQLLIILLYAFHLWFQGQPIPFIYTHLKKRITIPVIGNKIIDITTITTIREHQTIDTN